MEHSCLPAKWVCPRTQRESEKLWNKGGKGVSKNDNKVRARSAVNQGQNLSSYVDTELSLEDLSIHPPHEWIFLYGHGINSNGWVSTNEYPCMKILKFAIKFLSTVRWIAEYRYSTNGKATAHSHETYVREGQN